MQTNDFKEIEEVQVNKLKVIGVVENKLKVRDTLDDKEKLLMKLFHEKSTPAQLGAKHCMSLFLKDGRASSTYELYVSIVDNFMLDICTISIISNL